jgi:hypothetical protein
MSRVIARDDNEISQDFEELMKNQNTNNKVADNSDQSDKSDKSDVSDASLSIGSPQKEDNQRDNQRHQQQMMQQQMMQQQMMQQQMNQQRNVVPQNSKEDSDKRSSPAPVKNEEFTNNNSISKTLTLLGVLFALFFVFASPQVGDALGSISYLSNLPFASHINLLIRALLFVVIYGLLERFVL